MSPDSPEQEADYTLTPRTEAKYSKIDEDFQMMMQRNQQQRVAISGANYTLPVTVPITANYSESGMLQASPQMAHTNISPRPSSSETDSGNYDGNNQWTLFPHLLKLFFFHEIFKHFLLSRAFCIETFWTMLSFQVFPNIN